MPGVPCAVELPTHRAVYALSWIEEVRTVCGQPTDYWQDLHKVIRPLGQPFWSKRVGPLALEGEDVTCLECLAK